MASYMLDLETSVGVLRRRDEGLMERLEAVKPSDVCISAVTQSELLFGAMMSRYSSTDQEAVDLFLQYVSVADYPAEAGRHYGEIRTVLELDGEVFEVHEVLVAAHARCLGLVLVTTRVRELREVNGMRVENWMRA